MKTRRIEELKDRVSAEVDGCRAEILDLSHRIHEEPELSYHEVKASAWLSEYLSGRGFKVEQGICGIPTSFRASYGTARPAIAILAEYDALPGMGHGCGHNIIAAIAAGAAFASRPAVDALGGSVVALGTPAEELHGGKIPMIERGAFKDLDAALLVHPGRRNAATERTLACVSLEVEFFGHEAHASANPEQGRNALEAMLLSFNSINSLRQHVRRQCRVHGIITDGGKAANIVPGHSAGSFLVRSDDQHDLETLKARVLHCFEGAATATGTRLEYRWGQRAYDSLLSNGILEGLFAANLSSLGRKVDFPDETWGVGSTDMGNVSRVVPSIHASIAITGSPGITLHTPEFATAAASPAGDLGVLEGAKAVAMTVVDLLSRTSLLRQAWREFSRPGVAGDPGI